MNNVPSFNIPYMHVCVNTACRKQPAIWTESSIVHFGSMICPRVYFLQMKGKKYAKGEIEK